MLSTHQGSVDVALYGIVGISPANSVNSLRSTSFGKRLTMFNTLELFIGICTCQDNCSGKYWVEEVINYVTTSQ